MLLYNDIVKEQDPVLRQKAALVDLPISTNDLRTLKEMDEYLTNSYDQEFVAKYKIRPGVGIAAPQVGVSKRMFCIQADDEKGNFHHYIVVNPKIISESEQLTFLPNGEGCLSVDRNTQGLVMRHKKIKARCQLFNFDKGDFEETVLTLTGYIAIVFQHEYDHLDGVLFVDRINKENPFFVPENAKALELEK